MSAETRSANFDRARNSVFGILLAGYVLAFFHRTAPAAIAGELTQAFNINSAVLGTLAATYFFVYTLMQIPVGVLADTLGPRRIVTVGALVAGAGSLLFGLAPSWEMAAVGRTLVGIGVSVTFIALLKSIAVWFPSNRFATLIGIAMFAGNLGAVTAGAPLAWIVTIASWRTVFVGLGILSIALGAASWIFVRDRPEQRGFPPVHAAPPTTAMRSSWAQALTRVMANAQTWPGFFVNVGIGGSFLAFAGLWAVPFLQQVYGMPRNVAAQHGSLVLLGVALGSLAIGALSDRLRNRRDVMRAFAFLYALTWVPWLVHWQPSLLASYAWFFLMGLLIPGFVLTWTIAKEVNRPEHAGMATAVVNVGIFLGAGALQPLVGWVLDRGRTAGDAAHAWDSALVLLAGSAAFGAIATLFVRETAHRNGAVR
jgi:sugar phosphate permease